MTEHDASASRETARSRGAHPADRDPRDIVTEYAFRVDRELLGVPLASPLRRLGAILVDLVVLGLLFPFRAAASALLGGIVDLLVALAVAWVLFRLASPRAEGRTPLGPVRFLLRGAGVVVALTGLAALAGGGDGGDEPDVVGAAGDSLPPVAVEALEEISTAGGDGPGRIRMGNRMVSFGEIAGSVGDFVALARADGPEAAGPVAERVALSLHRMGAPPEDVGDALRGMLTETREEPPAWADSVIERAVARVDSAARADRLDADSLAARYARALEADDSAAADSLRPRLRDAVAGSELTALRRENRRLESELEAATRTPSLVRRSLDVVTDDLGIGLGWIGIYFTAFLALWKGRTPGKRLLGIRVVQLDGQPVGWWDAFGRFGGYAAGLATGLLGFLQVFWDPNRQALHDKVAGTVVIRTRGPGKRYR
jgi:hypothetical protein